MSMPSSRREGRDVLRMTSSVVVILRVLGIVSAVGLVLVDGAQEQLSVNFYKVACPSAEQIVRDSMASHFRKNANIAAQVLRLQWHDCAATGCDASVLLAGSQSERAAPPNLSLKGFDVIDEIKANVEASCGGIVSCSDILTMAARDAVFLTGGPFYKVPLGRFDSKYSGGKSVNLPSPSLSVPATIAFFKGIGLSTEDMVVLLGSHTIGNAHCSSFNDRLYNFQNTGLSDPDFDPPFLAMLRRYCPKASNSTVNTTVSLDLQSEYSFDNHFYNEMIKQHGVLHIDQELHIHPLTSRTVYQMSTNASLFAQSFAQSMVKMGQIGVKNSYNGVIRRKCSSS